MRLHVLNVYLPTRGLPISWLGFGVRSGWGGRGRGWHLCGFPTCPLQVFPVPVQPANRRLSSFHGAVTFFAATVMRIILQWHLWDIFQQIFKQQVWKTRLGCIVESVQKSEKVWNWAKDTRAVSPGSFPWTYVTSDDRPCHSTDQRNLTLITPHSTAWNIAIGHGDHSSYGVLKPISFTFFSAEVPQEGSQFKV